jgi:hypothetical protein
MLHCPCGCDPVPCELCAKQLAEGPPTRLQTIAAFMVIGFIVAVVVGLVLQP